MKGIKFIILAIPLLFMIQIVAFGSENQIVEKNLSTKDTLTVDDFAISNGIKLGQTISEVKRILGNPEKIAIEKGGGTVTWTVYSYPTITIGFTNFGNRVDYFNFDKKGLKTFRGIEIGDSEEKVIQLYGKTIKWNNNCCAYQLDIYNPKEYIDTIYSIAFYIDNNGQVNKIVVNFAGD